MTETQTLSRGAGTAPRLAWADALRTAAVLGVMVIHVSTRWLAGAPPAEAAALLVWDGLSRWCVPVFVMLSGMFLLDPDRPLPGRKLLRHLLRLLAALIFWGVCYHAVGLTLAGGNPCAALPAILGRVLSGDTRYHLWFLYMMMGLYLVAPLLRQVVKIVTGGVISCSTSSSCPL